MRISSYGAFTNPVAIRNLPVLNTHGAKVFWVDSNGGGGGKGTFQHPSLTIDAATALCTANAGDVVMIKAGHSETITGAGGITFDIAGVFYVGLGTYDNRPTFLMDGAATVTMLATAANVHIENCVFKAGHADVAVWATITAKGFTCMDCHFEQNTTDENFITVFSVGAADNDADGLSLVRNSVVQGDAADLHGIILNKDQNDVSIIGNRIIGDYDATPFAPVYAASTEIMLNILVAGNLIHNQHNADAAVGISIANTASTGWIVNNHVGHQDVAGETPILAGAAGLYVGNNYASGVLGTASGYIYPTIDS
jgi:hypothetical protein